MFCICMVFPKSIFQTEDEKNGQMEKMFIVVYCLEKAATFIMMFSYTYVKYCDSVSLFTLPKVTPCSVMSLFCFFVSLHLFFFYISHMWEKTGNSFLSGSGFFHFTL